MPLTQIKTSNLDSTNGLFFRNRIINGAMMIDQRNAGASVTPSSDAYTLDRWTTWTYAASKFSVQQNAGSVTPPTGFVNYLGITSTSAYSVPTGEGFAMMQKIEGYNMADLGWGAVGASSVTLSFWVRSSLTGTFGGALNNSAQTRSYPFSYAINSANTWEYKTVTIAGDTTGTWLTTNGAGILLKFGLGVGATLSGTAGTWAGANYASATGATSVVGTNGATFYITGVQLEKGTAATPFEYRPYGTELYLCQRYYTQLVGNYSPDFSVPNASYVNYWTHCWQFPQAMRSSPTVSQISGTTITMDQYGIGPATVSSNQVGSVNQYYGRITVVTSSPSSADPGSAISPTGTFWQASAEL